MKQTNSRYLVVLCFRNLGKAQKDCTSWLHGIWGSAGMTQTGRFPGEGCWVHLKDSTSFTCLLPELGWLSWNSLTRAPARGLTRMACTSQGIAPGFQRQCPSGSLQNVPKGQRRNCKASSGHAKEITQPHFYCILLVLRMSLRPAQVQGEGDYSSSLDE